MKLKWIFLTLVVSLCFIGEAPWIYASEEPMPSQILNYAGKSFGGVQDPEYLSYDQALRNYMVKRIHQKFGVELDPKKYSGFDLLEIEALLKCKKSEEPLDIFLKMFPKHP